MQSLFECGICLDTFDAVDKKPVVLQCGHTVCKLCVVQMKSTASQKQCPFCKKPNTAKVEDLPINY